MKNILRILKRFESKGLMINESIKNKDIIFE